ncbi:hypothetical protein BT69DRAFT_1278985 [Atractiella rhizophila]|nr:hypothetical protein BT69DRAFT_1278985 [Atractiella rhizophila]
MFNSIFPFIALLHFQSITALPTPAPQDDVSSSIGSNTFNNNNNDSSNILCSPSNCVNVSSLPSFGIQASSPNATLTLLPGSYPLSPASPSPIAAFLSSPLSVSGGFDVSNNVTTLQEGGGSIAVLLEPVFVSYAAQGWGGATKVVSPVINVTDTGEVESFLLPSGGEIRAILSIGQARIVVRDSAESIASFGLGASSATLLDVQSTTCTTECASGGFCSSNSNDCTCLPNFTGSNCASCLPNHFGPSCAPCPGDCPTSCQDGITGDGSCPLSTGATGNITQTPMEECGCFHGVCASNGVCNCNAGWQDAGGPGPKCSVCEQGYFLTTGGSCQACAPGCLSCSPQTGTCLSCATGFQTSSRDPTTCEPAPFIAPNSTTNSFTTCPNGSFHNPATGTCDPCSPVCSTCFGASSDQCVTCASPRGILAGTCVAVDQATGICDASALPSGAREGTWVFDNAEQECQPLPANCTAGNIPNFNSGTTFSDAICTQCQGGTFLSSSGDGSCGSCKLGEVGGTNGKCTSCPVGCASCTEDGKCLSCTDTTAVILSGTCVASCPNSFFPSTNSSSITNSTSTTQQAISPTCEKCHPDCATCSGAFDQCSSCPPSRPVLTPNGSCVQTCTANEFFDPNGGCKAISVECATAWGGQNDQCLSCGDGKVLQDGRCVDANCEGGEKTVEVFNVCLESLGQIVSNPPSSSSSTGSDSLLGLLALLIIPLLLLALVLWRRKNKKQRKQETARFRERMENNKGGWKMRFFGLGGVGGSVASKLRKKMPADVVSAHASETGDGERVREMEEVPLTPVPLPGFRRPSSQGQPKLSEAPLRSSWKPNAVDSADMKSPLSPPTNQRLSQQSYYSVTPIVTRNTLNAPLRPQWTGGTSRSEEILGSNNPFKGWENRSNHSR